MSLPVLMDPAAVAKYLGVTEDTLARWRASGTEGPAAIRIGQRVAYTENAVEAYITAQETGSKAATPGQLQAALSSSYAGVKGALQARREEMQALDRESSGEDGVTPLTMSGVGETPGSKFERFNSVPVQTFVEPAAAPHILNCR